MIDRHSSQILKPANNPEQPNNKKKKTVRKEEWEEAIKGGNKEDIEFLKNQTKEGSEKLQGFFKFKICLPADWDVKIFERCRDWLTNELGFEELLYGDSFAYSHPTIKVCTRTLASTTNTHSAPFIFIYSPVSFTPPSPRTPSTRIARHPTSFWSTPRQQQGEEWGQGLVELRCLQE